MTSTDDSAGDEGRQSDSPTESVDNQQLSLTPAAEAEVKSLLGSLPSVTMPENVRTRLLTAIEAEPNPYAETNVIPLARNHSNRNKWLVTGAGIAAVGVLGVVIGSAALTGSGTPPTTAAVVPVSQSGTVYQKGEVGQQVSKALPAWKSQSSVATTTDETSAATPSVAETPRSPSPTTTSGSVQATAMISDSALRQKVEQCLQRVDVRPAMHFDLGTYRLTATRSQAEPVAVAVVKNNDSNLEVYVLKMDCAGSIDDVLHEHVTIADVP